jgi:predicted alpha/beta-hydrolase family hydrolase
MNEQGKSTVLISENIGRVTVCVQLPEDALSVLVLAHGAGAGMEHPFMESLARELGSRKIGTVRYNFPYMENGRKRPDPAPVAEKTVARIVEEVSTSYPRLPLFAGGKSFGGRMTSQRWSKENPGTAKGIIFFGFPLHRIGEPSVERAAHLSSVKVPMVFIQGTRDKMADLALLRKTCDQLPLATLMEVEGADHAFASGKKDLVPALAEHAVQWIRFHLR